MSGPASNSPGGMHTHKQPCYPCAQQLSFQPGAKMGHKSKVSMLFLRGKIPQRAHGGAPGYLKKTALVKQRCRGVDCRGCFSVPSGWRHRGWQPTACPPLSLLPLQPGSCIFSPLLGFPPSGNLCGAWHLFELSKSFPLSIYL